MTLLLVNFAVLTLICFAVLALYLRKGSSGKSMQARLQTIHVVERQAENSLAGTLKEVVGRGLGGRMILFLRNAPFAARIEKLLLEANSPLTVLSVALVSASCAVVAGLACFVALRLPLLAVVAFLLGSAAPYGVLNLQRSSRLKAFNDQLPEALDLMTRALRAGHALGSAIELIGQESPTPLGPEFASLFQQQKLGVRLREAMLEMGARIPSNDLHFVITAILVQRETGGDVTEILERTTHVIRERARIEAEVRTRTAQGKLTGWILGLLPVVMLVLINLLSPGYSSVLFHDPTGQKLLYAGAGCIVVGGLIIRKIVDVKV
jgi:tight adherence protein B